MNKGHQVTVGGGGQRMRPPDGGWGWMVAVGSFITSGLLAMSSTCYSIIFYRFLLEQGASTTTTNWILNLHLFFHNLVGPFIGPLTKTVGYRKVSVVGSLFSSLCFLALVPVNSTWYLLVFFSISGIFVGIACMPNYLILAVYFDRRRGLASCFLMAGICVSQFAGPPMIQYLLDEYSLHGTLLIMSAIFLNSVVGSCLLQPVEWHMKPTDEEENIEVTQAELQRNTDEVKPGRKFEGTTLRDARISKLQESARQRRVLARKRRERQMSECSNISFAVSQLDLSSVPSALRLDSFLAAADKDQDAAPTSSATSSSEHCGILNTVTNIYRMMLTDLVILRSPRAIIIVGGGISSVIGYVNFIVMVPFAIQEHGYTLSDAAWCISIAGITNLIARLTTSALSDCSWFNMRHAYMAGATIMAISMCLFGFLKDLLWIYVVMGVWGCGMGMVISLYVLLMPRFMGLENMAAIFGAQSIVMAFAYIIIGLIIGFIRDSTNSYTMAMIATGVLTAVCVVMWAFMPAAMRYDQRKEQEKHSEREERDNMEELVGGFKRQRRP